MNSSLSRPQLFDFKLSVCRKKNSFGKFHDQRSDMFTWITAPAAGMFSNAEEDHSCCNFPVDATSSGEKCCCKSFSVHALVSRGKISGKEHESQILVWSLQSLNAATGRISETIAPGVLHCRYYSSSSFLTSLLCGMFLSAESNCSARILPVREVFFYNESDSVDANKLQPFEQLLYVYLAWILKSTPTTTLSPGMLNLIEFAYAGFCSCDT